MSVTEAIKTYAKFVENQNKLPKLLGDDWWYVIFRNGTMFRIGVASSSHLARLDERMGFKGYKGYRSSLEEDVATWKKQDSEGFGSPGHALRLAYRSLVEGGESEYNTRGLSTRLARPSPEQKESLWMTAPLGHNYYQLYNLVYAPTSDKAISNSFFRRRADYCHPKVVAVVTPQAGVAWMSS